MDWGNGQEGGSVGEAVNMDLSSRAVGIYGCRLSRTGRSTHLGKAGVHQGDTAFVVLSHFDGAGQQREHGPEWKYRTRRRVSSAFFPLESLLAS